MDGLWRRREGDGPGERERQERWGGEEGGRGSEGEKKREEEKRAGWSERGTGVKPVRRMRGPARVGAIFYIFQIGSLR